MASGSYRGANPQNGAYPITFFVAPGGRRLQNISIPAVFLSCTPPGNYPRGDHLGTLSAAIKPNGSFAAKGTQIGVFANVRARFTYSFKGNFRAGGASGTFREDIVFTDTARHRCTSNTQSWTVTKSGRSVKQGGLLTAGSYTGANPQNAAYPISFFVSPSRKRILNISIPAVFLSCAPPGNYPRGDHFGILSAAIKPNGSFVARGSQTGVFGTATARFTYSFKGFFEGPGANGASTAEGTFREDVVFTDTAAHTCTSNDQSWSAARSGASLAKGPLVTPGKYAGFNPQNAAYPITFSVAPGGKTVQNISIPTVFLTCVPPGNLPRGDHLVISSAPIAADGSFVGTGSQNGVFGGRNASFTYSFKGFFEGPGENGATVAEGSFREDIAFTDSAAHTCTSNDQSWRATRSS